MTQDTFIKPTAKPKRERTDHVVGRKYGARGWVGSNGKSYESRADWESSELRYHGAFTLPLTNDGSKRL